MTCYLLIKKIVSLEVVGQERPCFEVEIGNILRFKIEQ
jgi:hypothetical protein